MIRLCHRYLRLLFFFLPFSASAHRLNEYLQATTISLSDSEIVLHLHLTAGSDVAVQILKQIDANGDGELSFSEQQEYVLKVVQNISLRLDDTDENLVISSFHFPAAEDILKGTGDIGLIMTARGAAKGNLTHRLMLAHRRKYLNEVYLVNCLQPGDERIRVVGQMRNPDQSSYQLDFVTGISDPGAAVKSDQWRNQDRWAVLRTYFGHGLRHILTGYDHLLFLCALVLGAASLWDLVKVVTAFTIAHSLTLTLAVLHLLVVPQSVVEPVIAASIVFVAVQNIYRPVNADGKSRLLIVFLFGLFHGLGFAGGLAETLHHMPVFVLGLAIVGFSAGIEAGNQVVLIPLFFLLKWFGKNQRPGNDQGKPGLRVIRICSAAVAVLGLYYFFISLSV